MTTTDITATASLDTARPRRRHRGRDAEALSGLYAADATITILDRDHPPAGPQVLSGRAEIDAYYRDICGRNIDHAVPQLVADAHGVAFEQHCRYPEGNRSSASPSPASTTAGSRRQTIAQSWD